jgi:hypothetical protein
MAEQTPNSRKSLFWGGFSLLTIELCLLILIFLGRAEKEKAAGFVAVTAFFLSLASMVAALFYDFKGRGEKGAAWLRLRGTLYSLTPIVVILVLVLAPIHEPVRGRANESAAIGHVRDIRTAIPEYQKRCGHLPSSVKNLTVEEGSSFCEHSGQLDFFSYGDLISGYRYKVVFNPDGTYIVEATPHTFGITGNRAFYLDQSGLIRVATSRQATAQDPLLDLYIWKAPSYWPPW